MNTFLTIVGCLIAAGILGELLTRFYLRGWGRGHGVAAKLKAAHEDGSRGSTRT